MIRRLLSILTLAAALVAAAPASLLAEGLGTTATPVVPGYVTTTGCPSATLTPCFVPQGVPGAGAAGLPAGATPLTASGTGTTAAATATLTPAAGTFAYICGFTITTNATAATSGTATVGTVKGGVTLPFAQTVATAPAVGGASQTFVPCIQGNALAGAITVTSAAAGTGGNTSVAAWGYQQ